MIPRLAAFCTRRRWLVLILWIAALVGISFASGAAGDGFSQEFKLKGADSQTAQDLIKDRFPGRTGASGEIVFKADAGLDDSSVQAQLDRRVRRRRPGSATSPRSAHRSPKAVNARSHRTAEIGFAEIQFESDYQEIPKDSLDQLRTIATDANASRAPGRARWPGLQGQARDGEHRADRPRRRGDHPPAGLRVRARHAPAHRHRARRGGGRALARLPARPRRVGPRVRHPARRR